MHVITGLDAGGAEKMLASLAPRFAPQAEVRVASLKPGGIHRRALEEAGVAVSDLGARSSLAAPLAILRLAGLIRSFQPDVIQSWMYHADLASTLALLICGRRGRTRFYWGLRCSDMRLKDYGPSLRLTIAACRYLSRVPDAILANSEAGIAAHRRLGYRPRAFLRIDNGVDTARYRPDAKARAAVRAELGLSEAEPLVALIARVDPMKDHATFLAAFERLEEIGRAHV